MCNGKGVRYWSRLPLPLAFSFESKEDGEHLKVGIIATERKAREKSSVK